MAGAEDKAKACMKELRGGHARISPRSWQGQKLFFATTDDMVCFDAPSGTVAGKPLPANCIYTPKGYAGDENGGLPPVTGWPVIQVFGSPTNNSYSKKPIDIAVHFPVDQPQDMLVMEFDQFNNLIWDSQLKKNDEGPYAWYKYTPDPRLPKPSSFVPNLNGLRKLCIGDSTS